MAHSRAVDRRTRRRPESGRERATAKTWVGRDAAVVWHGFTQMAADADNALLVIERAEGRELVDADGRSGLYERNREWLCRRDGPAVVAVPGGEADLVGLVLG